MNRRSRRVVVVGGGPAGSACALGLRLGGVREVTVLERSAVLVDKACAGGLSPRAVGVLDRLGLTADLAPKAVAIRGARLVAPGGTERLLEGGVSAFVVRRAVFDGHLVDEAVRAGARVERGVAVDRILREAGAVRGVGAEGATWEADAVVLASGAHSRLTWDPRPRSRLDGVVARWAGVELEPGILHIVFDRRTLPSYAWLFPEPGGTVNAGLCCGHGAARGSITALLEELVDEHFPMLRGAERVGRPRGHPILYSKAARYLVAPGLLVVGEAGRLTDGFTGEGIWHALRSGLEAADALARGEPRRYELRARLLFDPVLRAADLMTRFASSRAFEVATRLATSRSAQRGLSRLIAGFG